MEFRLPLVLVRLANLKKLADLVQCCLDSPLLALLYHQVILNHSTHLRNPHHILPLHISRPRCLLHPHLRGSSHFSDFALLEKLIDSQYFCVLG